MQDKQYKSYPEPQSLVKEQSPTIEIYMQDLYNSAKSIEETINRLDSIIGKINGSRREVDPEKITSTPSTLMEALRSLKNQYKDIESCFYNQVNELETILG